MLSEENQLVEELGNVITKEKLGHAQRHDKELKIIREKAELESEQYFW